MSSPLGPPHTSAFAFFPHQQLNRNPMTASPSNDYQSGVATPTDADIKASPPPRRSGCCGLHNLGLILIIVGGLLTVIAIVYGSVLPPLINKKVKDGVVVCDASDAQEESYYDAYGDCDDCNPYYYTLHMFNASNAEAYLAGEDSKLQLVETGPYVFRRREFKIDINFLDDGARVSYKLYTYHTFEPSLSCNGCLDTDTFTSFDVGYLNVIAQAGGEEAFLMKLAAGSFSTNESVIADAIENYGPQMMRWVNGLNSLDPVAMNTVASGGTVLTFLATGPEAIADLDLSGFVYNGLFVTRTASQWALGYPSLLAGLGLGSEYVTSCDVTGGWNEKCASCEGDACQEIWYECKQCALGAAVVAINNVTCGIIEDIYAEEYGEEEAATFRENTCNLCEAFGLCAAPLPGIAEDSGLDYSKTPPSADSLETYIQTTGCADKSEILNYEEFNGFTSTALWVTTLGEERRNPTLSEILAFNDYGNCANPTANLTCSAVEGNDATSIKPGGAGMTGFRSTLTQTASDMYLDEGKQNVTLYSTGKEVDHEGITLHRFSPPNDLLLNTEANNAKGTGWPVDGVQPLAFSAGFLAYVSYPIYIYGNMSLLDAVEITMSDGVVASGDSMYESDSGELKQDYIDKYVTYIDVEAGTGKTMVAHKRLMASYAMSYSALNASAPMSDVLWPNLEAEVIFPAYWGEESATVGSSSVDYYHLVQRLLKSALPVLIVGIVVGLVLVGGGIFHRRKTAKQHVQRKDPTGEV
ncbi:Protein croquemort [Phytophthora citrophthora]|uniref:Protein croquemort n=1 Tax=Phytophthora citrophthora TaxID=4793 RepID=A0AAD9G0W9_9STRA|nr:Protein croquemort [Phytophthora citrophthora]